MITTEEIAVRVYQMLTNSDVVKMLSGGEIDYERNDYTKAGIVIIPHNIDGEGSVRLGQINVNIHVPDIPKPVGKDKSVYGINFSKLIEIRAKVIEVLQNHYEVGKGYNWNIGRLNPPIKERDHNEHFVSLALELTVRDKKSNQ